MLKFFQRFLCKHDFKYLKEIIGVDVYECRKCFRRRYESAELTPEEARILVEDYYEEMFKRKSQ